MRPAAGTNTVLKLPRDCPAYFEPADDRVGGTRRGLKCTRASDLHLAGHQSERHMPKLRRTIRTIVLPCMRATDRQRNMRYVHAACIEEKVRMREATYAYLKDK